MNDALERLDRLAAHLVPFVLTALLVMIAAAPVHLPGLGATAPNFALIAVFYWTLYRPRTMPAAAALCLGLWQDVLSGGPPGASAVILLVVHGTAVLQRRVFLTLSFSVGWLAFGLIAAAAAVMHWPIAAAYYAALIDPLPLACQTALTVAAYPLLAWFFSKLDAAVAARR